MDLLKSLTGKNPAEFEQAARILVNTPDCELFKKLVRQDDFLYDFVKENVAKRIQAACTKENYTNLLEFLDFYSPAYDSTIAEILFQYSENSLLSKMKDFFINGTISQKAYSAKYLSFVSLKDIEDIMPQIRDSAESDYEPLAINSTEILSKNNDTISKENAIQKLNSHDEFEQYNAIKFLVNYGAEDTLPDIINIMKKSSLSENIASEIPFLTDLESLLEKDYENAILVLCNIINAIPEIISPSAVIEYNIAEILENLFYNSLTSSSALLLRMAKEKFASLLENDEYLYDSDKKTKDKILDINKFLKTVNTNKLNSLLYDELYESSDFVFFAVDYVNDIEELETLLDSSNQTLVLKVLTILKDKNALKPSHKELALDNVTNNDIKQIINIL